MDKKKLQFKVSAGLKSIIGKDLITNKYIAIFELVKNAYDAYAEYTEIVFGKDKIIIKDDGKGMSLDDLQNKWLFVAYSAKADNTENEEYKDYRNKINERTSFAGAKGIGRFACDRLGKKLRIISLKESKVTKIESIEVFWESFEEDPKNHFIDIEVNHTTLDKNPYPEVEHGTILEITDLREDWNKVDIENLKRHLAKLINPIKKSKDDKFNIEIIFEGKKEKIENFIFDKLALKTTQINAAISVNGEYITTEMVDRGEKIYKIKEKNQWGKNLANTEIQLSYLNVPTKIMFAHLMGMPAVRFGSVFLYKNGFRVFPFGEERDDSLGLDRRKIQGYARYLGTRELVGFIKVEGVGNDFKETSSRDGGLIETEAYKNLKDFFFSKVLRRLEIYVVDTLNWTYRRDIQTEIFPEKRKGEITSLIEKLTESKGFINLESSYNLPEKIEQKTQEGHRGATDQLIETAKKTGDKKLLKAVENIKEVQKKQKKEIEIIQKQKDIAEDRASATMKITQQEFKNLVSYHHQIGISSDTIDTYISKIFKNINNKDYTQIEQYLQKIKKENDKINSISRIASGSGMKENATKKERSLPNFIVDYIENDYKKYLGEDLEILIKNNCDNFLISFRPFDITLILDNLISNSKKANATKLNIKLSCNANSLDIVVEDDGKGLDSRFINNPAEIFEPKTSTTNGSGWGLYHVNEILKTMNATIKAIPQSIGLKFVIVFNK